MKDVIKFLEELRSNNNREWFEANKSRYREIQQRFDRFAEQLIEGISLFDPQISGVTVKDSTYRIYRDIRFSPNKDPYKTHIGVYVCRAGKKSGFAGYYLHLEPGKSLLAVGLHCPDPKVVRSVRQEICDNGDELQKTILQAKGFAMDMSCSLQRVPREFADRNSPYEQYLKLKEFDLIKPLTAIDDDLLNGVLRDFRSAKPFNDILNRAVEFAFEEA